MFIRFSTDDRPPHWPLESIGSETLLTPYFCVLEGLLQSIFHCDRETTTLWVSTLNRPSVLQDICASPIATSAS